MVIQPDARAAGSPWIWRAEFFGHEPQFDLAMVARGWHVAYLECSGTFGGGDTMERWDSFYSFLTGTFDLSSRAVLELFSRGGLYGYRWAAMFPERVSAIYADAPVCTITSWPMGLGLGTGSAEETANLLRVFHIDLAQALEWPENPIDNLVPLADGNIPILHVCGDADDVVPMVENSLVLGARYTELGGHFELIAKTGVGHHPHSLRDPAPIIEFVEKYALS